MDTIRTFEQFINENRYSYGNKTYDEIIYNMRPGEGLKVYLPENFILEYEMGYGENRRKEKFECNRIELWYWDEDDHECLDYYFHTPGEHNWVCKLYYLTKDSYGKVMDYLRKHRFSENELYKDEPRNAEVKLNIKK
jgi:hypothetical protein